MSIEPESQAQSAGPMVREMEAHLRAIREQARGHRRRELEALFLLALEREELAAIGYGGEGVRARVSGLDADERTRAVVSHALRWAARDEATHKLLARGMLVRTGRASTAARTFAANLRGLVAGWAAAVLQHTTLRRAPVTGMLARTIVGLGRLIGSVPDTAADALRYQSFRGFCRFQLGAEQTAVMSWAYIAELLADDPTHARLARLAARIADDERKHERMMGLLLEAFDEHDRLVAGHGADTLTAGLARVDPAFVRTAARDPQAPDGSLGRGGTVYVREDPATRTGDPVALRSLLRSLLDDAGVLGQLARLDAPKVAIKTTFMMTYDRRDPSPHVDPALADELAVILREHGAADVAYLEGPNHYDEFFDGRSVDEVARYIGLGGDHYRIVDTAADQVPHAFRRGLGQDSVSRTWRDADVRVVFAKMRTHPSLLVYLAINALESLGRPIHEVIFHDRDTDMQTALMMIADAFAPDFALLDATHHVPDGLTGILGDPRPCHPGRLYAARDALALDLVAARHMGIERLPRDSALSLAIDWFDDPRPLVTVDGPDQRIADLLSPHRNDLTVLLSALAYGVYVYGGERGNLWMPVMDPDAFALRRRETLVERVARPTLRRVFGFGSVG